MHTCMQIETPESSSDGSGNEKKTPNSRSLKPSPLASNYGITDNLATNMCQNGFNTTTLITSFPSKRSYISDDPHEPDQINNEWEVWWCAWAGCHCVPWCFGRQIVGYLSLCMQQLDVSCETKTKGNVFVTMVACLQYRALQDNSGVRGGGQRGTRAQTYWSDSWYRWRCRHHLHKSGGNGSFHHNLIGSREHQGSSGSYSFCIDV